MSHQVAGFVSLVAMHAVCPDLYIQRLRGEVYEEFVQGTIKRQDSGDEIALGSRMRT